MEMADYSVLEAELSEILNLSRRPVMLAFRDTAPAGVPKFAGAEPSGCSFWRLAAKGMTFYTSPRDHANCVIGSYTYNYDLPTGRDGDLEEALARLSSLGGIGIKDIAAIPRMKKSPPIVIYSPLGDTPVDPDLVVFVTRPMSAMLLQEAALRSGIGMELASFGAPSCMSLTTALGQGMVTSAGCLGNRIYADLGDDELYVLVAGRFLGRIADAVQYIAESSRKLKQFHRERRRGLSASPE